MERHEETRQDHEQVHAEIRLVYNGDRSAREDAGVTSKHPQGREPAQTVKAVDVGLGLQLVCPLGLATIVHVQGTSSQGSLVFAGCEELHYVEYAESKMEFIC